MELKNKHQCRRERKVPSIDLFPGWVSLWVDQCGSTDVEHLGVGAGEAAAGLLLEFGNRLTCNPNDLVAILV